MAVTADGASGGGPKRRYPGGLGTAVTAVIPARPDETLTIVVGGTDTSGKGGFNGGGAGAYGGGGSSDVRSGNGALRDRIVIAGGGGGSCNIYGGDGAGGGGGGSSFVEQSATQVKITTGGAARGKGLVTIAW